MVNEKEENNGREKKEVGNIQWSGATSSMLEKYQKGSNADIFLKPGWTKRRINGAKSGLIWDSLQSLPHLL